MRQNYRIILTKKAFLQFFFKITLILLRTTTIYSCETLQVSKKYRLKYFFRKKNNLRNHYTRHLTEIALQNYNICFGLTNCNYRQAAMTYKTVAIAGYPAIL